MTRGKRLLPLVLAAAFLAGCKQPVYLLESDVKHYTEHLKLPPHFETDPHASLTPPVAAGLKSPMTVLDTDRKVRYMPLSEAIAVALEQGTVGSQSPLFPGIGNDQLVSFNGRAVGGDDAIRVLALDPAISAADIEASLSKFDTRWVASMTWQKQDNGVLNVLQSFQNGDLATLSSAFVKPLPTGGTAGITFSTDYTKLSAPPQGNQIVNPAYRPRLQASFEQPLLQGYGIEINQLTPAHPGSVLNPGVRPSGGTQVEGILITRIRFDQARADFERNVNFLLLNVENAYWTLYGSYFTLYAREQALRQAFEIYRLSKARYNAGRIAIQDFAQTKAQFEQFRFQRIQALDQVLENERQLRNLLGLDVEDGTRIVPSDEPTLSPFAPDWCAAVNETLANRPELTLARQDLKFRQLDVIRLKNNLRPDFRFFATYDVNGIGTRLDDANPANNALRSFINDQFNNYQLGFRLDVPLGNREGHSQVRVARLNLARSYYALQDQERKSINFLYRQYRQLFTFHEQIRANRAQREANAEQVKARFQQYTVGFDPVRDPNRNVLDLLLEAQRNFAQSLADEYTAVTNYNNALSGFQFAKGTIVQYNNVVIAEGPLPACAAVRAVDHINARKAAIPVRTLAVPTVHTPELGEVPVHVTGEVPTNLTEVKPGGPVPSLPDAPAAPAQPPAGTTPQGQ